MLIKYKNKGFSLIEALVAITVLVFGIIGPLTLAQMSLRSFPQIRDRITAEYLAAEGMEVIKNIRDEALIKDPGSGFPNFTPCQGAQGCYVDATQPDYFEFVGGSWKLKNGTLTVCPVSCPKIKYYAANGSYNYSSGVDQVFTRRIFITVGNITTSGATGEKALVRVRVEWPSRFIGTESVEFSSYLTDWFRF